MFSWPFRRQPPEPLTPIQLRDRLVETAASGSNRKLRVLCRDYKDQVVQNIDLMRMAPDEIRSDSAAIDRYVQCLGAVAHCLAHQCAAPELWNALCGAPVDNPLIKWDRWYGQLTDRMERLEYEALIAEARGFVEEVRRFQGAAARQNEAYLNGRLGELLFHSGRVCEAGEPFQAALQVCRETDDCEGQRTYLNNLLEVHRYAGNVAEAVRTGEELAGLMD